MQSYWLLKQVVHTVDLRVGTDLMSFSHLRLPSEPYSLVCSYNLTCYMLCPFHFVHTLALTKYALPQGERLNIAFIQKRGGNFNLYIHCDRRRGRHSVKPCVHQWLYPKFEELHMIISQSSTFLRQYATMRTMNIYYGEYMSQTFHNNLVKRVNTALLQANRFSLT
jgi:hypothetical protein